MNFFWNRKNYYHTFSGYLQRGTGSLTSFQPPHFNSHSDNRMVNGNPGCRGTIGQVISDEYFIDPRFPAADAPDRISARIILFPEGQSVLITPDQNITAVLFTEILLYLTSGYPGNELIIHF